MMSGTLDVAADGTKYYMPHPGHEPVESLTAPYIGGKLALESAWRCGSTVLRKIMGDWKTYYAHVPGE